MRWDRARAEIVELGLGQEVEVSFFAENARRVYKWDAGVS
jgi:hypothetical protein